jgi:hypothetical protein
LKKVGFCSGCGWLLNLCKCSSGCGCNGEMYWSEWHNDPPYCQDPCNCHGQWIGPSSGCGCNGGCATGGCYNGSCAISQPTQGKQPAYAQQTPVRRTQVATNSRPQQQVNGQQPKRQPQPAYVLQKPNQQPQVRTASRPMPQRLPASNGNTTRTQAQPILW